MQDMRKTKTQLVAELHRLREEIARLEVEQRDRAEEGESKFRSLAEAITAHISIVREDGYVYANPAFLDYHGLDLDDLELLTFEDLMMGVMGPGLAERAEPAYKAAIARGERRFHFEFQDLQGRWFLTNVTIMELDDRPAYMIMDLDITELKQAQVEMFRADKMAALGQIISGVAHEINNPNNFIYFNLPVLRRYLEAMAPLLVQRQAEEPSLRILGMSCEDFMDDVLRLIQNMEHGSERITGIVSDLRGYLRGGEEQEHRAEQVGEVLERVMALVGKQLRKMVKHLDVEIEAGLLPVEMNPGKIEQVVINLLINAGQAADKEESRITVTARAGADGWVEVTVSDNGAGIPKGNLERIFEPFFTSKGRDHGTGLGLAISQRIIEEHRGTITVESRLGEGTCFTIRLPTASADPSSDQSLERPTG